MFFSIFQFGIRNYPERDPHFFPASFPPGHETRRSPIEIVSFFFAPAILSVAERRTASADETFHSAFFHVESADYLTLISRYFRIFSQVSLIFYEKKIIVLRMCIGAPSPFLYFFQSKNITPKQEFPPT